MPGEREVPGPAAGLQAGPREGAQREGAAEAWGQAEEERERGEEVRHGVLRRRHQVREVKVSMRQHFTLEVHLYSFEDYHDSLFSQLQYPMSVIKSKFYLQHHISLLPVIGLALHFLDPGHRGV